MALNFALAENQAIGGMGLNEGVGIDAKDREKQFRPERYRRSDLAQQAKGRWAQNQGR